MAYIAKSIHKEQIYNIIIYLLFGIKSMQRWSDIKDLQKTKIKCINDAKLRTEYEEWNCINNIYGKVTCETIMYVKWYEKAKRKQHEWKTIVGAD